MNKILLILGIAILSIAASVTTTKMINVPAKPVQTICFKIPGDQASDKIITLAKQGWQVQHITDVPYYSVFVVMVKY